MFQNEGLLFSLQQRTIIFFLWEFLKREFNFLNSTFSSKYRIKVFCMSVIVCGFVFIVTLFLACFTRTFIALYKYTSDRKQAALKLITEKKNMNALYKTLYRLSHKKTVNSTKWTRYLYGRSYLWTHTIVNSFFNSHND